MAFTFSSISYGLPTDKPLFCEGEFLGPFSRYLQNYPNKKLAIEDFHIKVLGEHNQETIVLIHGLDSAAGTFYNITDDLAKKYKVVLYDQRGHGKTADINNNFSSIEMANDLKMILDHLKIDKAHILGHSMGARTATRFVNEYPEMSSSLIIEDMEMFKRVKSPLTSKLIGEYYSFHDELKLKFKGKIYKNREELQIALEPYWKEEAKSLTYRRAKQNEDGSIELMFRPWNSAIYSLQGNAEDFSGMLSEIKQPVLIMQADGERGTALSDKGVEHIKKNAPHAQHHFFKGAGHTIHRADKESFMNVIESFLMKKDNKVLIGSSRHSEELKKFNMLPRGSALMTSSGSLEKEGITNIIHAATGSMTRQGGEFEPTIESISNSIENSMKLAKANGHKRIAIPFVGGAIFLQRIGTTPEILATEIIKSAINNREGLEVRLVAFDDYASSLFKKILNDNYPNLSSLEASVVKGSITEYELHQASAIVNAANMEVIFGAGLSGAIARATSNSQAINNEASLIISGLK